jgi:hypothetical protein
MKVLILGFGSIGQRHYGLIRQHFPDIQVAYHEPALDADTVFICNPTEYHIDIAITCIQRMPNLRNIFCEKPLDVSSKRLDELKGIVGDRVFYLGYPLRFNPVIQEVNNQFMIKTMDLICHSNSARWPSNRKLNHVLLELSHEIDLAYYLSGEFYNGVKIISSNGTKAVLRIDHAHGEQTFIDLDMKAKREKRMINVAGTHYDYQVTDDDYLAQLKYFLHLCETGPKRHMNDLEEAGGLFREIETLL